MSKVLEFARKEFGRDGLVSLTRGDDWDLSAKIIEEIGGVRDTVLLSDIDNLGVSGYFPADTLNEDVVASGLTRIQAVIVKDSCSGKFRIQLPSAKSELVQRNENGTDIYLELENNSNEVETIYSFNQPIAVRDQNFTTF